MNFKIGYVIKILNKNIKVVCVSYHKYNFKYKKLLVENLYLKIYDSRNEILLNDYILFKYYKKSKDCNNRVIRIL